MDFFTNTCNRQSVLRFIELLFLLRKNSLRDDIWVSIFYVDVRIHVFCNSATILSKLVKCKDTILNVYFLISHQIWQENNLAQNDEYSKKKNKSRIRISRRLPHRWQNQIRLNVKGYFWYRKNSLLVKLDLHKKTSKF